MNRRGVLGFLGLLMLLSLLLLPLPARAVLPAPQPTLADRQLHVAQRLVRYLPNEPDGYNHLAAAALQKSRETGDFSYTSKAETALARSLQLAPDNPEALKLKAMLLLTYHQFQDALELTQQLQHRYPQDPQIGAALIDAWVELGNYPAAESQAKKLLKLHPIAPVYARVSYLRSLHGDSEGAIAAMRQAIQLAPPGDREGMAWYRVQLGNELINVGKLAEGEREIDRSLETFPQYPLGLAAKAHARVTTGEFTTAIAFYQQALERVPLPEAAIALGDLYLRQGDSHAAQKQYALVEFIEQTSVALSQTYSRQLALFWANHNLKLDKALDLMRHERLTRADIFTFDVLAWCLFKQGDLAAAKTAIDQAMRLGTRDARIYYHAGMIYHGCGDRTTAAKYLKLSLQINPAFDVLQAEIARQTLNAITT
jgi:tetratricopeptide (TPR) repeat protein